MGTRTFEPNTVDWEERVNMDRLRTERSARLKPVLHLRRAAGDAAEAAGVRR